MTDTLGWKIEGHSFRDGSLLADWEKIYQDSTWHWQYDTHEMTFAIYKHDGQYWKLYHGALELQGYKLIPECRLLLSTVGGHCGISAPTRGFSPRQPCWWRRFSP